MGDMAKRDRDSDDDSDGDVITRDAKRQVKCPEIVKAVKAREVR
jgi:hypothetical protein